MLKRHQKQQEKESKHRTIPDDICFSDLCARARRVSKTSNNWWPVILYWQWIINVEEIWKLKPSRKTRERWSSFFQGLWRHHCHDVEMKRCWIYPSKLHKNKKGKHKEYNAVNPTTTLVVDPLNNDDNQAAEPLARSKAIIDSHNTHNSIGAS